MDIVVNIGQYMSGSLLFHKTNILQYDGSMHRMAMLDFDIAWPGPLPGTPVQRRPAHAQNVGVAFQHSNVAPHLARCYEHIPHGQTDMIQRALGKHGRYYTHGYTRCITRTA